MGGILVYFEDPTLHYDTLQMWDLPSRIHCCMCSPLLMSSLQVNFSGGHFHFQSFQDVDTELDNGKQSDQSKDQLLYSSTHVT